MKLFFLVKGVCKTSLLKSSFTIIVEISVDQMYQIENNGHDMGYRVALTIEELGEFAAAITKGKPKQEASEELADLLILILGHSLAMQVDLESEFHSKMDKIMQRKARRGNLGIRVTEYEGE